VLTKQSRVARFFLVQYTKAVKTYTKWLRNCQMPIKYTQWS
jgi:hypothetical protein